MKKAYQFVCVMVIFVLLAGCTSPTNIAVSPTSTAESLPSSSPTQALPVTATQSPTSTETNAPASTSTATIAPGLPAATDAANGLTGDYLDDRSTPGGLILSLFNAFNRKEYLRAYAYWENPAADPNVGTFDQFRKGYESTASTQVTIGTIHGGAGAGQRYYSVPVVLKTQTTNGQMQTFAGCYTLHLASPDIQTAPPFQPLGIRSAEIKEAASGADPNSLLEGACPSTGEPVISSSGIDHDTIDAANYLDDRSTPIEVLRSLFNAVNRKEYARVYSYWQTPGQTFEQLQQGYQNTASVDATFGAPSSDIGAGQLRYRVPVAIEAQTTDGKTQFFVGCYQLHLAQPANQMTSPFQPLGIEKALVKSAATQTEATNQMASACQGMQ